MTETKAQIAAVLTVGMLKTTQKEWRRKQMLEAVDFTLIHFNNRLPVTDML